MSSNDAPAKLSKMADSISVKGAREHNLKNISVDIPRNQLVVRGAGMRSSLLSNLIGPFRSKTSRMFILPWQSSNTL